MCELLDRCAGTKLRQMVIRGHYAPWVTSSFDLVEIDSLIDQGISDSR